MIHINLRVNLVHITYHCYCLPQEMAGLPINFIKCSVPVRGSTSRAPLCIFNTLAKISFPSHIIQIININIVNNFIPSHRIIAGISINLKPIVLVQLVRSLNMHPKIMEHNLKHKVLIPGTVKFVVNAINAHLYVLPYF